MSEYTTIHPSENSLGCRRPRRTGFLRDQGKGVMILSSLANDIEGPIEEPDELLAPSLARTDLQDSFFRAGWRDLRTKDFGL